MAVAVQERRAPKLITKPQFRDPSAMSEEELNDPDFRLKQLGLDPDKIKCTKCHHCRR